MHAAIMTARMSAKILFIVFSPFSLWEYKNFLRKLKGRSKCLDLFINFQIGKYINSIECSTPQELLWQSMRYYPSAQPVKTQFLTNFGISSFRGSSQIIENLKSFTFNLRASNYSLIRLFNFHVGIIALKKCLVNTFFKKSSKKNKKVKIA